MARKKSNVKALALAVTCAILAGGYSGLNPVYAADGNVAQATGVEVSTTISGTNATVAKVDEVNAAITQLNTNTSKIEENSGKITNIISASAGTTNIKGSIVLADEASALANGLKISSAGLSVGSDTVSFAQLKAASDAVEAVNLQAGDSLATSKQVNTINTNIRADMATQIGAAKDEVINQFTPTSQLATTNAGKISALEGTVGDDNSGLVKKVNDNTAALASKANADSVYSKTEADGKFETIANVNEVKTRVESVENKTQGITHADANSTVMNGVTFKSGLVSAATIQTKNIGTENMAVTNGLAVGDPNGKLVSAINGNLTASDALTVGNQTEFVNATNGNLTATGKLQTNNDTISNGTTEVKVSEIASDHTNVAGITRDAANNTTTIEGKLKVKSDGTVTINEGDANQVMINSDGIKVGTGSTYISGDAVYTGGADYDNAKAGMKNDGSLRAAGGKFTVDGTNGNTTVGGTLNVTGDTTLGNATVGGTLGVTGDATFDGKLKSKGNFSVGDSNEFTVDAGTGNVVTKGGVQVGTDSQRVLLGGGGVIATNGTDTVTLANGAVVATGAVTGSVIQDGAGAQMSGGNVTAKGALSAADGKFNVNGTSGLVTFGNDAGNQSTIAGKTATFGAETGDKTVITGGNITANSLTVASFSSKTITADEELKVGTDVSLNKDGTLDLGTNTLTDAQLGNINATIKDGQVIEANSGKIGGVQFSTTGEITAVENITAKKGTIGEVGLEGGKITANNGGTIAGVNFATGGVVTGVSDLTATGTVKAATLKVNDNNVLDSNGLKAEKAVIDNITIDGASITSNNAEGSVGIAGITVDKNGAMTGVKYIDGVKVAGGNTAGGLTIGDGATAVTIGGNSMALSSTNFGVDNDGDVTGQSFTAGNSYLKDGELKLNDANIWTTAEGIKAEKATIGANTLDSTGFSTTGTLDVAGKATFGSNAANSTTIEQGAVSVTQNGKTTTIKGGELETDKLTVNDIVLKNSMKDGAGNTITISGTDGSLSVASGAFAVDKDGQLKNKITGTDGGYTYESNLETSKSGINANYTNAVNGNNNLLAIDKNGVSLGVTDATNQKLGGFAANKDNASLSYGADNSIVVDKTTIKSALGTDVSTTLTNNGADQSIVNKVTDNATSTIKSDSIVNKVGSAKRSLKADEIVDEAAGMTVKTNSDGTLFTNGTNSTLINGSKLTSTNGTATGVLDGSNLTLDDGTNKTEFTAGGATFTKGGKTTTIDGDTITTGKLVTDELVITGSGNAAGDGGSIAFGGNGTIKSNIKGEVGTTNEGKETTFETKLDGVTTTVTDGTTTTTNAVKASGNTNTVTNGVSTSSRSQTATEITDKVDNASSTITNESITSKVTDNATSTITKDSITDKVGGTTVETKDGSFSVNGKDVNGNNVGMNIDTTTGKTTFTGADYNGGASGTTTIDGNTITTGKLVTDELVITGNGDAAGDGSGSLAFGGNGTIKSNIKGEVGTTNEGKETTFETKLDGVTTTVTDGTTTTTNAVKASGNTNTVTNGTATSKNTQTATSIGGVVTNGTVKIAQTLDGEKGNITNEVTDKDGNSSKLVQNGTGLEYTDSAKADNATRINSSDVSIGSATDDSKRINLSDLGQIDDLDSELSARDEFKNNSTAVGGINAEAAARREDVARLDNRIDDVNNRVDKVGAMAAAIASLKSIGYDPQAPSEFSVGLGQYKGETGVALGFFHYPNKNFMINVSLSTAGGETMGGIGATWRFGHKSPQKLLNEQREAQARKELAAAEKYKAAAQLAKEAQERAEYAAKLARQAQVSADNAKAAADATQSKHFNK